MNSKKAFIFIGRSGSGKGTQANCLMGHLAPAKSIYIQSGAELREFIKGDSYTQKLSATVFTEGKLQKEFVAIHMWTQVLLNSYTGEEFLVFDGSPRRVHEAGVMLSMFEFYGIENVYIIHLDVPKDVARERLIARKRIDDTLEGIEKRLNWYDTEVLPTLSFFKDKEKDGFFVIDVNGNQPVDKVCDEIVRKAGL